MERKTAISLGTVTAVRHTLQQQVEGREIGALFHAISPMQRRTMEELLAAGDYLGLMAWARTQPEVRAAVRALGQHLARTFAEPE